MSELRAGVDPTRPAPVGSPSPTRLFVRWLIGLLAGTVVIAATSPWFVRSYLPRHLDPIRQAWVLEPGQPYRWRSEGYATTSIGPHGMPGRRDSAEPVPGSRRIALWGDSQAEGVCVADEHKLFAQLERAATPRQPLAVYPFARSGDEASDWRRQLPSVERAWQIDHHVFLIADLPDLFSATTVSAEPAPPPPPWTTAVASLPDFVVHAARGLFFETDGVRLRRLRFTLGPEPEPPALPPGDPFAPDWDAVFASFRAVTLRPVTILYAPQVPSIVDGEVRTGVPLGEQLGTLQSAAERNGIAVVDLREPFLHAAEAGCFPHGFHNGRIGVGHLNADGYRIAAEALIASLRE